jgi:hypothetical protein
MSKTANGKARTSRRSPKNKRSRRPRRNTQRASRGTYSIDARRTFTLYPKQTKDDTSESETSWLDAIFKYGTIAAKLILATFATSLSAPLTLSTTVVGAIQTILIGIDDLVMDNPFVELDTIRKTGSTVILQMPKVDFKQAKLARIHVRIAPSAEVSKRGGLVAAVLIPLTREESDQFQKNFPDRSVYTDSAAVEPLDSYNFTQLQQFPNAVVRDASKPISISQHATGFQAMKHAFGTQVKPDYDFPGKTHGGPVLYKLCIGYSDLATYKADPSERYRPEESTFHISINSVLHLSEPGATWIRAQPYLAQSASYAAVTTPESFGRIICQTPISNLTSSPTGISFVQLPREIRELHPSLDEPSSPSDSLVSDFQVLSA